MRNMLNGLFEALGCGLFVLFLTVAICSLIFATGLIASNLLLLTVF